MTLSNNTSSKNKTKLAFLSSFDNKFQGFRREMERLSRAVSTGKSFGGKWPTEGLEQTAKSLIGAGAVYGLPKITDWAKTFLARLDTIRLSINPPTQADLDWLGEKIGELEKLQRNALNLAGSPKQNEKNNESRISNMPPISDIPPPPRRSGTNLPASNHQPGLALPPPSPSSQKQKDSSAPKKIEPIFAMDDPSDINTLNASVFLASLDNTAKKIILIALRDAGFVSLDVQSPREMMQKAVNDSPELIIIDLDDPDPWGNSIANTLQKDPLTDYIPVLKIGTPSDKQRGDIVPKPINAEHLVAQMRRVIEPETHAARIAIGLRDPNLDELVNFVSEEIRAGVLDSVTGTNAQDRFRLMNEGKIMASIWAMIAQLRKAAATGSRGKIRFIPATSGQMGMMALAEAEEILDTSTCNDPDETDIQSIKGLRAVVADDDPKIRSIFDSVLTSAGVEVLTAENGLEALKIIRKNPPDFIFSDIVMPKLDGWELCNRLRADYYLRHIPVILLSWKEDFLERLRGLKVDANEFMLKEVDRRQILARTIRAMKPSSVLQRQLGINGDVIGRIERVGVLTIIKSATSIRSNCRITFKESWNYFEVDIRGGELVAVTRTGTDGSFTSGSSALERLLGVNNGRFSVIDATDTPRSQFKEGTDAALQVACQHLNALVAQVIDGALLDITKIDINDDVLKLYAQIMPPKLRVPLQRLNAGESPKKIILDQETSPDALETLLIDLIRTGAIRKFHAPPPDLTRTPIARDSARWKAIADGQIIAEENEPLAQQKDPVVLSNTNLTDQQKGNSNGWKVVAALAILALALSGYFNWRSISAPSTSGSTLEIAIPNTQNTPPAPTPISVITSEPTLDIAIEPEPTPVAELELKPEPKPAQEPKSKHIRKPEVKVEPNITTPKNKKPIVTKKRETLDNNDPSPKKKIENDAPKTTSPIVAETGILTVSVPAWVSTPIKISVDGKAKGKAPAQIKLSPGLHEVTFTINGKRELRMVSIKPGKTKSIFPREPK